MKEEIRSYFENLAPQKLGLNKKIRGDSIVELARGASHYNYLVKIDDKKFVFRLDADVKSRGKCKREFRALKLVEKYKIAPKAWVLDESKSSFKTDLLILDYIEGKTLEKSKLTEKIIKKIAKIATRIHSIKITKELKKLKHEEINYRDYLKEVRGYINYIKRHIKNSEFINIINKAYFRLKKQIPKKISNNSLVLSQGDFCRQNVIFHTGKYRLIDFESLALTDPAAEIAHIFIDFSKPFNEKQKQIFLREYLKIRKDAGLIERIKTYIPLKHFIILLWSVSHVLKMKNKHLHEFFIKGRNINKDIAYAKLSFKRAINAEVINNRYKDFDIRKMLK